MRIKSLKNSVAVAAFLLVAGMAVPAMADSMDVSISASDGVFNDPLDGGLYFAGAIQYNDTSGTDAGTLFNVFCDDPNHDVGVPGTYNYVVENEAFAQNYLSSLETGVNSSTNNVANEIAALSAYGLANLGNANLDEAVQLAIWSIEGSSLSLSGSVATRVNNLLNFGGGIAFWDNYWSILASKGFSYGELYDGDGVCVQVYCSQTQGQMYIAGGGGAPPPDLIPEPGTLGLLGFALFGLGAATWRRRKSASGSAA